MAGGVDRVAVQLAAWRDVARRALVDYERFAETGEGTPPDGQRAPETWWARKLAAVLGGLLDAVETEPEAAGVSRSGHHETVTQFMAFVQRERRSGRHVDLDALGRLFGAETVAEATRRGWLLDHGDGRVAPAAGWLNLHR